MDNLKAEIYDVFNVYQYTLSGYYDKGAFHYKEGGYTIPFTPIRIWGAEKSLECDLKGAVKYKKDKIISYTFDGTNYKQRFTDTNKSDSNIDQYLSDIEKGMMAKELALEEPISTKQIVEFIMFAILMIGFATNYFEGQQLSGAIKPIQNVSILLQHQVALQGNETLQLYKLYNQSYLINRQLLVYLQTRNVG